MLPKTDYDVIIVGAGPAGLTGGMYCGRAKLRTLIIEQATIGGTSLSCSIKTQVGVQ